MPGKGVNRNGDEMAKLARVTGSLFVVLWLHLAGTTQPSFAAAPFDLDCGEGRVVTGVSGAVEPIWGFTVIGALRVSCVTLASNGIHAASPYLGSSISTGDGGTSFSMSCPPGHAVDRIFGTKGSYIDSLAVYCRSLTGDNTQTEALDHVGGDGSDQYDIACPAGEVARKLTGTSGAVIDTLDLDCHAVPYGQVGQAPSLQSPASNHQASDQRPAFHWTWPFPGIDSTHIAYSEVCLTTQAAYQANEFCDVEPIESTTATDLVPEADLPVSGLVHWTARGCNLIGQCGPWGAPARWLTLPGDEPTPPPGPQLPTATFVENLYPVYAHPRCTNCHGGYNPFGFQQGNSALHPGFAPSNLGNAQLCANCHPIDGGEWQTWKDPDDSPGQIPLFAIWLTEFGGAGFSSSVRGSFLPFTALHLPIKP